MPIEIVINDSGARKGIAFPKGAIAYNEALSQGADITDVRKWERKIYGGEEDVDGEKQEIVGLSEKYDNAVRKYQRYAVAGAAGEAEAQDASGSAAIYLNEIHEILGKIKKKIEDLEGKDDAEKVLRRKELVKLRDRIIADFGDSDKKQAEKDVK